MLAEAVTGASAGPASLIVLALVLLVAFGRVLRRPGRFAGRLLGLAVATSGVGAWVAVTMVVAVQ
ncbi:MAG TPA: hypothetical protein VGL64_22270 [Amycolatopsis sp.]